MPSSFFSMPRHRLFQSGNATPIPFAEMASMASTGSGGAPGGPNSQPSAETALVEPSCRPVRRLTGESRAPSLSPENGHGFIHALLETGTELVDGDVVVGLAGLLGSRLVRGD